MEPCDICSGLDFTPYVEINLSHVWAAQVWQCQHCAFRQVRPRLTDEEVRACYQNDYFSPSGTGGFADYGRQYHRHAREAHFLAKQLRRLAPRGRFLEVGSALGFLLHHLSGFCDWEVEGLDLSPLAVRFARETYGLNMTEGTLEDLDPGSGFDFILQKDLLEHVRRPREHLRTTASLLRPGGHCLLITPNGETNLRPLRQLAEKRATGETGLPLLDQAHLSFFAPEHLRRLFRECGLTVVRARTTGLKRGLRALGVLPAKKNKYKLLPAPFRRGMQVPSDVNEDPRSTAQIIQQLQTMAKPAQGAASSALYREFRQVVERLDSLPGDRPWGNDFEYLLRRD